MTDSQDQENRNILAINGFAQGDQIAIWADDGQGQKRAFEGKLVSLNDGGFVVIIDWNSPGRVAAVPVGRIYYLAQN